VAIWPTSLCLGLLGRGVSFVGIAKSAAGAGFGWSLLRPKPVHGRIKVRLIDDDRLALRRDDEGNVADYKPTRIYDAVLARTRPAGCAGDWYGWLRSLAAPSTLTTASTASAAPSCSRLCIAGVSYLQFPSDATVEWTPANKVKTCNEPASR
jgi:hypothetical protein